MASKTTCIVEGIKYVTAISSHSWHSQPKKKKEKKSHSWNNPMNE